VEVNSRSSSRSKPPNAVKFQRRGNARTVAVDHLEQVDRAHHRLRHRRDDLAARRRCSSVAVLRTRVGALAPGIHAVRKRFQRFRVSELLDGFRHRHQRQRLAQRLGVVESLAAVEPGELPDMIDLVA